MNQNVQQNRQPNAQSNGQQNFQLNAQNAQNAQNGQSFQTSGIPNNQGVRQGMMPGANGGQPNNASQFIKEGKPQAPVKKKKKTVLSRELITIIGVIAIVGILYFTYNYQLNKNLETFLVPSASRKIPAGSMITADDIVMISVAADTLNEVQAIRDKDSVVGKYVNYDTIIPEHSLFYSDALSATNTAPNSIFKDLSESEIAIMIDVNLETTYGNSIMKGDIVDIYVDAIVENNGKTEYVTGPLVTGAKVLAVLDSSGNNVFADHENVLTPSYFVFTLDSNIINLIRKAQKLSSSQYAMSIYPVIDGKTYKSTGATKINETQIIDLINNATIDIKNNN